MIIKRSDQNSSGRSRLSDAFITVVAALTAMFLEYTILQT